MRHLLEHSHNASTCPFCVRATGYMGEHGGKKTALKTRGLKHTHATRKSCGSLKNVLTRRLSYYTYVALYHSERSNTVNQSGRAASKVDPPTCTRKSPIKEGRRIFCQHRLLQRPRTRAGTLPRAVRSALDLSGRGDPARFLAGSPPSSVGQVDESETRRRGRQSDVSDERTAFTGPAGIILRHNGRNGSCCCACHEIFLGPRSLPRGRRCNLNGSPLVVRVHKAHFA